MKNYLFWIATIAAFGAAGYAFRAWVLVRLEKVLDRTATSSDDFVLKALRNHLTLWFLFAGFMLGARWVELPPLSQKLVHHFTVVGILGSLTLAASTIAGLLIRHHAARNLLSAFTTGLFQNLAQAVIFIIGILLILSNLGVAVGPLLAALGFASLSVALALQDTIANFFAGIYIILSRNVRPGDHVRLESGQEGIVAEVGWRSCRIQELSGSWMIVPNVKISQLIVTNYSLSEKETPLVVSWGVAPDSDLGKVESVTLEAARSVQKEVPGGAPDFDPTLRFTGLGGAAIRFNLTLRVRHPADKPAVQHELVKRLQELYRREGIGVRD